MSWKFGLGLLLAATIIPTASDAITLTNRDPTEQKFTVIEGDKQTERTIKPGEKLDLCPQSCVIRLDTDYEFDGPEVVFLQDGILFLDDGEDKPQAQQ